MSDRPARLQVLAAALCFGTTGTAQELWRPDRASPVAVGAARIVLGGALLIVVARSRPRRGAVRLGRWALPPVLVAGIGVAVYQSAFFAAVDRTGVAVGTVVAIGCGPAIAGVLGRMVNAEPLTGRWAAATALAGSGVATLGLAAGGDASVDAAGVGLAVLAGAGYAAYTVLAKRLLLRGCAPEAVMAATFGTGGLLLVPLLVVAGTGWLAEPRGLLLAAYLGAVTTTVAYILFARGLQRLSSGETATLVLAEPLVALTLGAVALGERPGATAIVGGVLVLAGILVLARPGRRAEVVAPVPVVGVDA